MEVNKNSQTMEYFSLRLFHQSKYMNTKTNLFFSFCNTILQSIIVSITIGNNQTHTGKNSRRKNDVCISKYYITTR